MDVQTIYGADDISAERRDVHVAEVNVLPVGRWSRGAGTVVCTAEAVMLGPCVQVGFRCSGRCWGPWKKTL